uniref:Uncharacterized protein n=1 Tax=Macaca fascicularis TaxID=9541 RepID=A0A7N9CDB2_MACFA
SMPVFEAVIGKRKAFSLHCFIIKLIFFFFFFFESCDPYVSDLETPLANFLKTFVLCFPFKQIAAWNQSVIPHLGQ